MNKYIRTKDGRIIDLQKFIEEEKKNPNYTDYEFEEIKNEENSCSIHWTAVGTKENSQKDQVGRRCQFGATASSPFIAQADTIEKLSDEFRGVWINYFESKKKDAHEEYHYDKKKDVFYDDFEELTHKEAIEKFDIFYAAIWTEWGLRYVAKMKEILPNGEIDWELV